MEIILKEDVIGLGYKNDIVNVKAGYGRNYLIPTGKGILMWKASSRIGRKRITGIPRPRMPATSSHSTGWG